MATAAWMAAALLACQPARPTEALPARASEPGAWLVRTPGRAFTPPAGIDEALRSRVRSGPSPAPALVQLVRLPSAEDRARLRESGVLLGALLGGTTYFAEVATGTDLAALPLVRWAGPVMPADRVEGALLAGRVEPWARADGERIRVLVSFRVDRDAARAILDRLGVRAELHGPNDEWAAQITPAQVQALAGEEGVRWLEQGPHPMMPLEGPSRGR
jgi:hypothetical protein